MPRSRNPYTFQKFLDVLARGGNYKAAMAACGYEESLAWKWMAGSRRGEERYVFEWRGNPTPLHVAVETTVREWNDSQLKLAANTNPGRLAFDKNGEPLFLPDLKAIAEWEGDAEAARKLGGLTDPFFLHDAEGNRIQARNPVASRFDRNRPDVKRLEAALAELQSRVDRITKPQGPPNLGVPCKNPFDPAEGIGSQPLAEKPKADLRSHPRAYEIPALKRPPQTGVPAPSLDQGERTGRGTPPLGGMRVA